jgi:hypothetical protein
MVFLENSFNRKLIQSLLAFSLVGTAFAREETALSSGEVHAGGGIVLPSVGTALRTNPAGLSDQRSSFRLGLVSTQQDLEKSPRLGIQAIGRLSLLSAGVLYEREKVDKTHVFPLRTGVSFRVPVIELQLGVSNYRSSWSDPRFSHSDFGAIWQLGSLFRIGAVLVDPSTEKTKDWGFGLAAQLSDGIVFFTDSARDRNTFGQVYKPGLKLGNRYSEFTVSFGTGESAQFRKGWSIGGSFQLLPGTQFEILALTGGDLQRLYLGFSIFL